MVTLTIDRKTVTVPEGTTILAAAVIDDVLGIICLAIVMGIVGAAVATVLGQVVSAIIGYILHKKKRTSDLR